VSIIEFIFLPLKKLIQNVTVEASTFIMNESVAHGHVQMKKNVHNVLIHFVYFLVLMLKVLEVVIEGAFLHFVATIQFLST
jgi:hypothetical protein